MNNSVLSSDAVRLVDQICDRFEADCRTGNRPRVDTFLGDVVGPTRSALLRQLLLLDWEYARQSGSAPRAEDYQTLFPEDTAIVDAVVREVGNTNGDRTWCEPAMVHSTDRYSDWKEIGRGGIGVVYRARDRILGRDLAVKILREAYRDNADARQRFVDEAKIGSQMQHPAIVPVYEIGEFDDGRPYFTMKLVEGQTLAELMRRREFPDGDVTPLLGYFEQICQAIAYAHARGILHRDLKPTNVMVGAFGEVQVMDWGFAKHLQSHGDDAHPADAAPTRPTGAASQSGSLMGTPAYMPPEQARGKQSGIDRRSDVFALGAILCEILTGRPPYVESNADHVFESAVQGRLEGAYQRLDACRADEPLRELAIRCLAPDAVARPPDAGAVALELTAYFASTRERLHRARLEAATAEAAAREARATVRAERRARRTLVSLAAVLLLGAVAAATLAVVAHRAKERALTAAAAEQSAKKEAEAREAEARSVLRFVKDHVLAAAQPKGARGGFGRDVSVRQALTAAAAAVDTMFHDQPRAEAELRSTLGETLTFLGEYRTAAQQYRKARQLYFALYGPEHHRSLETVTMLANTLALLGDQAGAAKLHRETLDIRERLLGPDHPDTLKSMNNLAMCYDGMGDHVAALNLLRRTLAIKEARFGPNAVTTISTLVNLANTHGWLGHDNIALKLRQESVTRCEAALRPDDAATLMCRHNLANSYRKIRRFDEALTLDEGTLKTRTESLPPDHPDLINSLWSVAKDLVELGRGADAVPYLDQCLTRAVGKAVHRNFSEVADLRLRHFETAGDAAGCRTTAELWEKLGRTDPDSLFHAACFRSVTASVLLSTNPKDGLAIEAELDRAMTWLQKAVAAGYDHWAVLCNSKDLDPLRNREDFKTFIATLHLRGMK
ncbi:MAG TPA: serine/threonine-protein kinase [Fimbriiglobus sp.]